MKTKNIALGLVGALAFLGGCAPPDFGGGGAITVGETKRGTLMPTDTGVSPTDATKKGDMYMITLPAGESTIKVRPFLENPTDQRTAIDMYIEVFSGTTRLGGDDDGLAAGQHLANTSRGSCVYTEAAFTGGAVSVLVRRLSGTLPTQDEINNSAGLSPPQFYHYEVKVTAGNTCGAATF